MLERDNIVRSDNNQKVINKPVVFVLVCIYMFLFIERPWESIRHLQGIPIERPFALIMIVLAALTGKLKIVQTITNKWVYGLLLLHFALAPFAFGFGYAIDQGIEYAKMVILYLLMLAVTDDEKSLKILVKVFVFSMMIYVLHSLWEYHNGRNDFKMGITRMLGADRTFCDPNAFGASVVLSLPFVYTLLRIEKSKLSRAVYFFYFAMAVLCVVLTGSRSSSVALVFMLLLWSMLQRGKLRILVPTASIIALATLWINMPDQKRERIRTLWSDDTGTVGGQMSAEGRIVGWQVSWEMFKREPLTGVGAGGDNFIGYRMANKVDEDGHESPHESHVLYGQVLAEFGVGGAVLFSGLVLSIWKSCLQVRKRLFAAELTNSFAYLLTGAIIFTLILLLLFGFSGHNFYRPLWLWLAAWAGALYKLNAQRSHLDANGVLSHE